jgi:hypothetical protein
LEFLKMSEKKKKKKLTGLEKNESYAESASTGIGGKYSPLAAMIRGASSLFHDKEKVKKARKKAKGKSRHQNILDSDGVKIPAPFAMPGEGIPPERMGYFDKKPKGMRGGGVALRGFGRANYSKKDI